jgi:hypothetical protein
MQDSGLVAWIGIRRKEANGDRLDLLLGQAVQERTEAFLIEGLENLPSTVHPLSNAEPKGTRDHDRRTFNHEIVEIDSILPTDL